MNRSLFVALLACALAGSASAQPLDSLFAAENLWTQKRDDFMQAGKKFGYQWTSAAKDSARAAQRREISGDPSEKDGLTAFGLPVVESVARFDGDKLSLITMVLYARGDARRSIEVHPDGPCPHRRGRDQYQHRRQVHRARQVILSTPCTPKWLVWATPKACYLLEFSKTKALVTRNIPFRAEFVRLGGRRRSRKPVSWLRPMTWSAPNSPAFTHVKRDGSSGDVAGRRRWRIKVRKGY